MKEGWEIKKLCEVCDVVGGSTPKTSEESYWGGEHYWISPAELDGSKYVYSTSRTITEAGIKSAHLQMLPVGTVLLSSRAPIGKVAITKVPMYCNQGFKNLVCKNEVLNEFVYWFLLHNTEYLNSLGTGATFKEISKKVVEQVSIPVPSIAEQEKIVAELDCLSGIIEKKKQQLKEYDALAQSIFYEMFGDPVENEKGWEIKKMNEVAKIAGGYAFKSNLFIEEGIPVLRIGNINTGRLKTDSIVFYQEDSALAKYLVYPGDLVMSLTGTVGKDDYGNVCVLDNAYSKYYLNQRNAKFILSENIQVDYLKYFLKDTQIKSKLTGVNRGVRQGNISNKDIEGLIVHIPPLALQQEFASKIEAIEKQKALIKKSIEEVETLFNSRIDYYFN